MTVTMRLAHVKMSLDNDDGAYWGRQFSMFGGEACSSEFQNYVDQVLHSFLSNIH
jgi:hypothetical protein